jgi:predicted HTH transcriptional regulator
VTSDEDAEHLACPSTSKTNEKVDQMKELILKNRRVTNREGANRVGISFASVQSIILKDR